MACFAVLFEDVIEGAQEIRACHMPAHLDFLERHAATIHSAGPLLQQDGTGKGGLWLVEAQSLPVVESLVREDPFWSAGLRKSIEIGLWRRVFHEGKRLI